MLLLLSAGSVTLSVATKNYFKSDALCRAHMAGGFNMKRLCQWVENSGSHPSFLLSIAPFYQFPLSRAYIWTQTESECGMRKRCKRLI